MSYLSSAIRILVVDNQSFFRSAVHYALADIPGFTIVAEATTLSVLGVARDHSPDIALCGVNTTCSATDMLVPRRLHERLPHIAVIVLTPHTDDDQLYRAAQAGAAAYLEKDAIFTELGRVISEVADGQYPISRTLQDHPFVMARILNTLRTAPLLEHADATKALLSTRERDVLSSVALGQSNKEIGYSLGISEQTVKNHLASIYRKLRIDDRTTAAIYAMKEGMISDPSEELDAPVPSFLFPETAISTYAAN
jgi:DNA-binding NarL/FixJ family response regulator